jgi:hypothetical protein
MFGMVLRTNDDYYFSNWLIRLMETQCVSCEAQTEYLNINYVTKFVNVFKINQQHRLGLTLGFVHFNPELADRSQFASGRP